MKGSKRWPVLLGIAGVLECSMGLYHSVLPFQMGWRSALGGVPDSIVWALFALNFSWSLAIFLAGCFVIYAARLGPDAGTAVRRCVFGVGLFWLIHGAYTWLNPMPLPRSLAWLVYALDAFPVLMVALHWLPLSGRPAPTRIGPTSA